MKDKLRRRKKDKIFKKDIKVLVSDYLNEDRTLRDPQERYLYKIYSKYDDVQYAYRAWDFRKTAKEWGNNRNYTTTWKYIAPIPEPNPKDRLELREVWDDGFSYTVNIFYDPKINKYRAYDWFRVPYDNHRVIPRSEWSTRMKEVFEKIEVEA